MYPSVINSFNRPSPSDRLNSPSHSALHNAVSSALSQVETFVGVEGPSSVAGTLVYDIRSPGSDGGGHVQTAVKGGTGQTTFTKGDILVAQSASVLTKLAVGQDDTVLQSDSSTSTGLRWATTTVPKLAVSGSVITVTNSSAETSIMSVVVPGSTLGTNNAVRATVYISNLATDNGSDQLTIRANYGSSSLLTAVLTTNGIQTSIKGTIEFAVLANGATNAQVGNLVMKLTRDRFLISQASTLGADYFTTRSIAEDSSAPKTLGVTATWNGTTVGKELRTAGYIAEKIT